MSRFAHAGALQSGSLACLLMVGSCSGTGLAAPDDGLCPGELSRARTALQRIEREWPLRGSGDAVTGYVRELGDRIARRYQSKQGERGVTWRFSLVRNLAPNAFSIGAGYVFVTEGAVSFARTESELAAILAHEMGHQLAGHFCGSPVSQESRGWFDIFSSPKVEQDAMGVGSLTQVIDPVKEQQADQYAVSILQAADLDPRAMLDVARRLPTGESSHLVDPRRIQALERLVGNLPRATPRQTPDFRDFRSIQRLLDGQRTPR
jgi:predicted Zn-dependent protease